MIVLFLCSENTHSDSLRKWLEGRGETVTSCEGKVSLEMIREIGPDIIVSYNYRFILKPEIFGIARLGAINLHISFLPWNRGADPNFWCHLEGTPGGVTIHYIDEGVDTGDIIAQKLVQFDAEDTLATSYQKLHLEITSLFRKIWPQIIVGAADRIPQVGEGTSHRKKDKIPYSWLLRENSYDTLISELQKVQLSHEVAHSVEANGNNQVFS